MNFLLKSQKKYSFDCFFVILTKSSSYPVFAILDAIFRRDVRVDRFGTFQLTHFECRIGTIRASYLTKNCLLRGYRCIVTTLWNVVLQICYTPNETSIVRILIFPGLSDRGTASGTRRNAKTSSETASDSHSIAI